jgi:hypothetical protein
LCNSFLTVAPYIDNAIERRLAREIEVVREARIEGVELAPTRRTESSTYAKARF